MNQNKKPQMAQLYLPNSAKFSNKLLIKRLGTATPHTIQFQSKDATRCHNMNSARQRLKNISIKHKVKKHLIFIEKKNFRHSPIRHNDSVETKNRKLSFSRMVQESSNLQDFDFSYITHFYKRPIEKELAAKRQKKDKPFFSEVLNVIDYNPHQIGQNKFKRTIKTNQRCRCHKHSHTIDFRDLKTSISPRKQVSTSMRSRQIKTRDNSVERNRYTASEQKRKRRKINLNIPENWNVQSWGHVKTKLSDKDAFEREENES